MKTIVLGSLFSFLMVLSPAGAADPVFRNGDDLVVQVPQLDQLRQVHPQLVANLRIVGVGSERRLSVDLHNAALAGTAVTVDLTDFGLCRGVAVQVVNGQGQTVYDQKVAPVPSVTVASELSFAAGEFAAIERGTKLTAAETPRIALPDVTKLRTERLLERGVTGVRSLAASAITYPVIADADLPAISSNNYVIVSRQSFAPQDPTKVSLYFSYRKAIFDEATAKLKKYRKLLVEVPLDRSWLETTGDQTITLPLDRFAIHTTDELERMGNRWNAPQGYNMLGESSTGLFQGGQVADTDDQGRIYITNVADGAGIVRFNPHVGKFEQPPVNLATECRRFLPTGDEWRRNWDAELPQVVCARGRVFLVFDRNYRANTSNGKFETCSGVVSVPQENWHDADAFRRDIRLHAACWPSAKHPLYTDEVQIGAPRRLGLPRETTRGLHFGTWRLDLDEQGNTERLVQVSSLDSTTAVDGSALPRAEAVKVNGLSKQMWINVGHAGRKLLEFNYGEFSLTRAALTLALPGASPMQIADPAGRARTTIDGAPPGKLTVMFDLVSKLRANPQQFGEVTASLTGISQGPNYAVIAIPDEPQQALGVCEYSYYMSKIDFSRRHSTGKVFRSYLPFASNGQKTGMPLLVGLGPYNTVWVDHDNARWLYVLGYTGMSRMKYATAGRVLDAFTMESFYTRLAAKPLDGRSRDHVKDFLQLLPTFDGQWIDIGRGRPGRGGGAYSAGLELFDPTKLGTSQTLVKMNRCFGLHTPTSRVVHSVADQSPRQEFFIASGNVRTEYLDDLEEPSLRPASLSPKVFTYDYRAGTGLRDQFGFALPTLPAGADSSSNIVLSPCQQYLIVLQEGGAVLSYHITQRRFVDGVLLKTSAGDRLHPLSFSRPSANLWTAPNGQIFFHAALEADAAKRVVFFEVRATSAGRLEIVPHLIVTWESESRVRDFERIVHSFLPDLTKRDGSYDLVLGGDQDNGGQPTVRVIDDFIPPCGKLD